MQYISACVGIENGMFLSAFSVVAPDMPLWTVWTGHNCTDGGSAPTYNTFANTIDIVQADTNTLQHYDAATGSLR